MRARARIARLEAMSALLRERKLAELRAAERECRELRAELGRLADAVHARPEPGDELRGAVVIARHQRWCAARRRALNIRLAAAMARRFACRSAAAQALGRHMALARLRERGKPRRPEGD